MGALMQETLNNRCTRFAEVCGFKRQVSAVSHVSEPSGGPTVKVINGTRGLVTVRSVLARAYPEVTRMALWSYSGVPRPLPASHIPCHYHPLSFKLSGELAFRCGGQLLKRLPKIGTFWHPQPCGPPHTE